MPIFYISLERVTTNDQANTTCSSMGELKCLRSDKLSLKLHSVMRSSVRPQGAPQPGWGEGPSAARLGHLPSKERLPKIKMSVKEQTASGSMLLSPWKPNVQHYFVCLATATPKLLKTANKLQLSCPWKLPGFTQKTTHHMLPRKSKAYSLSKPELCNMNPEKKSPLKKSKQYTSFFSWVKKL